MIQQQLPNTNFINTTQTLLIKYCKRKNINVNACVVVNVSVNM